MGNKSTRSIVTPPGTLSFCQTLFEKDDKGKYSTAIVFKPGTDISDLQALVEEAVADLAPKDTNVKALRNPLSRDGAEKEHLGGPYVEGAKFFTAKTNFKPQIIDGDQNPIFNSEDVYAGCTGRLLVHCYYYDRDGNKGIGFGLDGVQKMGEGERIAGGVDVTTVFDKVSADDLLG